MSRRQQIAETLPAVPVVARCHGVEGNLVMQTPPHRGVSSHMPEGLVQTPRCEERTRSSLSGQGRDSPPAVDSPRLVKRKQLELDTPLAKRTRVDEALDVDQGNGECPSLPLLCCISDNNHVTLSTM